MNGTAAYYLNLLPPNMARILLPIALIISLFAFLWLLRWLIPRENIRPSKLDVSHITEPHIECHTTKPPCPPEIIPEPIVEELEEVGPPDALEQPVDAARVARQAEYREFLKSDKWLALREEALNRDGRRCRYCNSVDHLEVHHRYYPKVRGTETVDALTTICHRCHSILSAAKQKNKTNLADGQSSEP